MRKFEQKRKIQKIFYSKLSIFFLLILIFVLARGSLGVYSKARESLDRRNSSQASLNELQDKKKLLEEKISKLDSQIGLEKTLRTRYSLIKDGEKVITIVEKEGLKNEANVASASLDPSSRLTKIKSWIKRLILLE